LETARAEAARGDWVDAVGAGWRAGAAGLTDTGSDDAGAARTGAVGDAELTTPAYPPACLSAANPATPRSPNPEITTIKTTNVATKDADTRVDMFVLDAGTPT
jgi:hypothetical protein